jgi:hypothetical protein
VVFFSFHFMIVRTVCFILFFIYDSSSCVLYFVFHLITVQTVWYILFFILWQFERCGIFCFSFYDCSDDVVYFIFHFITVRTVWYILFFILWQFEQCGMFCFSFYNCSNGVLYFVFHLMTVRTVWYNIFLINEKQNIPHCLNSHQMRKKLYHTVRTVIKWEKYYTTLFEQSSNEKQNIARTVWYNFFLIWWLFKQCGIFCFSFYYYFADDEVMIRV